MKQAKKQLCRRCIRTAPVTTGSNGKNHQICWNDITLFRNLDICLHLDSKEVANIFCRISCIYTTWERELMLWIFLPVRYSRTSLAPTRLSRTAWTTRIHAQVWANYLYAQSICKSTLLVRTLMARSLELLLRSKEQFFNVNTHWCLEQ